MKELTKEELQLLTDYVQSVYTPKDYPFEDYMKLYITKRVDFFLYKNFGGNIKDLIKELRKERVENA